MGKKAGRSKDPEKAGERFEFPIGLCGIDAVRKERAWVVGSKGFLIRTLDGGENWDEPLTGIDASFLSVCALDENTLLVGGNKGLLMNSRDGGTTWGNTTFDREYSFDRITAANESVL